MIGQDVVTGRIPMGPAAGVEREDALRRFGHDLLAGLQILILPGWKGLGAYLLNFIGWLAVAGILWLGIAHGLQWLFVPEAKRLLVSVLQPVFWTIFAAGLWRLALATLREKKIRYRLFFTDLWIVVYLLIVVAVPFFAMRGFGLAAFYLDMPYVTRPGAILLGAALLGGVFYSVFALPLIADRKSGLIGGLGMSFRILRGREFPFIFVSFLCFLLVVLVNAFHILGSMLSLPVIVLIFACLYEAWLPGNRRVQRTY